MQATAPTETEAAVAEREDARPSGTLIIGIGNSLFGDDGAGIHVIERLGGRDLPAHVELVDGGTLSFTLLEKVEGARRLIIVDAAELDAEPGTVQVFRNAEMDGYLSSSIRPSVHEVNLLDVLTAARLRGRLPEHYALVGIQPRDVGWSSRPSTTVDKAVDAAVRIIVEMAGEDT